MSEYIVTTTTEKKIATATEVQAVMSDTPPQYREFPRSSVELAGQSVSDITHGIRAGSPLMMGVVVLNVIGIAAAVYFLNLLISGQQGHLANLLTLQTAQLEKIIAVHNREFDALMEMQKTVAEMQKTFVAQQSAPSLQVAPQPTLPPVLQPRPR